MAVVDFSSYDSFTNEYVAEKLQVKITLYHQNATGVYF